MGLISQFIPTVGTYLAIALPALIAMLSDQPLDAVWVIIFATVYQQIENYFFAPRISARTMDIHPAVAFGSVIAGAALFGPIGALIGIPVAAAILAFAAGVHPPLRTHPGTRRSGRRVASETQPAQLPPGLFCQSLATLTCRSRYTRVPEQRLDLGAGLRSDLP